MPGCNQNLFQTLQKLQKRYIANLQKKTKQFSCSNWSIYVNLRVQILNIAKRPVIAVINVVTVGSTDTFRNAWELKGFTKLIRAMSNESSITAHVRIITFPRKHQRLTFLNEASKVIAWMQNNIYIKNVENDQEIIEYCE